MQAHELSRKTILRLITFWFIFIISSLRMTTCRSAKIIFLRAISLRHHSPFFSRLWHLPMIYNQASGVLLAAESIVFSMLQADNTLHARGGAFTKQLFHSRALCEGVKCNLCEPLSPALKYSCVTGTNFMISLSSLSSQPHSNFDSPRVNKPRRVLNQQCAGPMSTSFILENGNFHIEKQNNQSFVRY